MSFENVTFDEGIVLPENMGGSAPDLGDIDLQIAHANGPAMAMKLIETRRAMEDQLRFQAWLRQSNAFCQLAENQRLMRDQLMRRTEPEVVRPAAVSPSFSLRPSLGGGM